MVCVSELSNEILGWWATKDAKVMHPPNYDAYKAYLSAKRVWLENDSLAYAYLIDEIRLDNSFPDPYFILADEPTGNLDTVTTSEILDLFDSLNKQGKTIIIVTHEDEVSSRAKRIVRLRDGLIQSDERN